MKAICRNTAMLILALLLYGVGAAILMRPAYAAGGAVCGSYAQIKEQLIARYGEALAWTGILPTGAVAELTVNPSGRAWTMLIRDAEGNACLVLSGSDWTGGPALLIPGVEG